MVLWISAVAYCWFSIVDGFHTSLCNVRIIQIKVIHDLPFHHKNIRKSQKMLKPKIQKKYNMHVQIDLRETTKCSTKQCYIISDYQPLCLQRCQTCIYKKEVTTTEPLLELMIFFDNKMLYNLSRNFFIYKNYQKNRL